MFQAFTIPCSDPDNWTNNPKQKVLGQRWNNQANNARWFKDPTGWSKWYASCEKAYGKMIKAEQREERKSRAKSTGKKAKTCGFCGGVGHNRRDCPEMQALNERIIKANAHWRKRAYDYFVKELGLGAGALIRVDVPSGWNQPNKETVGIVSKINWDELNMFCYMESATRGWRSNKVRLHENLQAPMTVDVIVDGETRRVRWKSPNQNGQYGNDSLCNDQHGRPLVDVFGHMYNSVDFLSIVSPTETPLSQEWLSQGQQECVAFITKRYPMKKLKEWGAIDLLESYEKRYNLK
tara:strand:- start:832 stop:1710 length:879 start_codon:yes stop_codon:yes gene_type:complete